jgi:hypothetical protein
MRGLLAISIVLCVACDSNESEPNPTPSSTGDVVASSTSTGAASSSSSSTGEPDSVYAPEVHTCRKECDFAADCCPADIENCPAPEYPGNFGCVDGLCVPAPCESDEQCEFVTPGTTCHDVDGVPQCVVICDSDDPCAALGSGFACGGQTTDGQGYCRERCDLGTPCLLEECNPEGICECSSDSQCVNGFACDAEQ